MLSATAGRMEHGEMNGQSGKIIFLHGASSSGKSTTARAFQATVDETFLHLSIDHLRDSGVLPSERFRSGELSWPEAKPRFFDGFHQALAAFAGAGNNLIVEHIIDTPGWLEQLTELFRPFDVFFVGLHCERDELIRREAARGDRPIGSAAQDHDTIHDGLSYDLELHSKDGVEANVRRLLAAWHERPAHSVFAALADRLACEKGPSGT